MLYLIKNGKIKNLLLITFVYFITHWFLLIVSGRWWDDWCFYLQEDYALNVMAYDMGRPSLLYIVKFLKFFPEPFYRVLTFLMFYYCSLSFYKILDNVLKIRNSNLLLIILLFITVPINIDRVMFCVFPYTLGLFFFMLGMDIFFNYFYNTRKIILRIICLLSFLLSFVLNSCLFFYGILFLLIIYKNRNLKCLMKYFDFILLPIIFFIIKNKYFPTGGAYVNYNSVGLNSIIKAIIMLPFSSFIVFVRIFKTYFDFNFKLIIIIIGLFSTIIFIANIKNIILYFKKSFVAKKFNEIVIKTNDQINLNIYCVIIGVVLLMIGLFPYIVVRSSLNIYQSRDIILTGFGLSMILYGGISILFKAAFEKYIITLLIIFGVLFFNYNYLTFQKSFYQITAFQHQIIENNYLQYCGKNIMLRPKEIFCCGNSSCYSLTKAYYEVSGKQDKFIFNYSDTRLL